jgi:beta-xylosidase
MKSAFAALALCVASSAAEPMPVREGNPLFAGADPHCELIDGTWWVYPTGGGTRLFAISSKDLRAWQRHGPILDLGDIAWVKADGRRSAQAWAPCIARRNNKYYLYFSVGPQSAEFPAHIGVARGDSPAGPFKDSGKPLLTGGNGFEAIDPMVFHDPASNRWLLYAGGSAGARLRVFELKPNMAQLGDEVPVDTPPQFTEGAFMHLREGIYHLTYSHGGWQRANYSVHHATAKSPTGPWHYRGPILTSDSTRKGPGHHSIVRNPVSGAWLIIYHRWENVTGDGPYSGSRQVAVDLLRHLPDGTIAPVRMSE